MPECKAFPLFLLDFSTLWQMLRFLILWQKPHPNEEARGLLAWFLQAVVEFCRSCYPTREILGSAVRGTADACLDDSHLSLPSSRLSMFHPMCPCDTVKPSIWVDVKCFLDASFTRCLSETDTKGEVITTSSRRETLCYVVYIISSSAADTWEMPCHSNSEEVKWGKWGHLSDCFQRHTT